MECENAKRVNKIKIVRAIDLINIVKKEPKPKFIWGGIPEGSMGLITGVAKTGKTTFAENLAISLSVGKNEFFGEKLSGSPQKVLFINLEESYRIRSWRNEKQISVLSDDERKLFCNNYISTPTNFIEYINNDEQWEIIRNYIIESEAEIIFIDSLTHMFASGEIEKSKSANDFVQKLNEYLGSLNKTIIIIHHNVKGNDKPIEQDNIAGSRVILQKFQYAYGFANIPTGGNYSCMLNNKYISCDSSKATTYNIDENNWFNKIDVVNKFSLYKGYLKTNNKIDGRIDNTNPDLIYEYIASQSSTTNQTIKSSELNEYFVEQKIMSKDTMHKSINKLITNDKILKQKKGEYKLNEVGNE